MSPIAVIDSGALGESHDTGLGHPERPSRLSAVRQGIDRSGAREATLAVEGRPATRAELSRVHRPEMLDALQRYAEAGGGSIDADTVVCETSFDAALLASGSGLVAVDVLDKGSADSAFVAVRPPGHHATAQAAMGFCLLNHVAVCAAALADRGERVLIVDWDVHHGNGTQDIFWDDPRVLFVSTHEWPQYPGTGRSAETGGDGAPGLTVNVPLPAGATGDVARAALDEIAAPVVERFEPTWVLISAGFDAHRDDPLGGLDWTAGDYADLAADVTRWAPRPGRVVAFLEGGYDLDALALSAGATVATLAGIRFRPESASSGGPGRDRVSALAEWWRRVEVGSS